MLLHKQKNQPPQFIINVDYIIEASNIEKNPTQMKLSFYTGNQKLIRNQKEWKIKFENPMKRERFYRLLREAMPNKQDTTHAYKPQPLPIRKEIMLSVDNLPVAKLASALHDHWIASKQQAGWKTGNTYDEVKKTNPEMCEWVNLTESQGKYDLDIAKLACVAMFELGYDIKLRRKGEIGDWQEQVTQLIEFLAENTHESWASNKMAQGFKPGKVTDSTMKTHCLLKPYVDMTDVSKEADREAAKTIIAELHQLGYGICKRDEIDFNS